MLSLKRRHFQILDAHFSAAPYNGYLLILTGKLPYNRLIWHAQMPVNLSRYFFNRIRTELFSQAYQFFGYFFFTKDSAMTSGCRLRCF